MGWPQMDSQLQSVIQTCDTRPAPEDNVETYLLYWYKAIASVLLSSRVRPTNKLSPNKTDVHRICKQMNFNPHLFSQGANILIRGGVISVNQRKKLYEPGDTPYRAFFADDLANLIPHIRKAFLNFLQEFTGYVVWRPTIASSSGMVEFLMLFFRTFQGLAFPVESFGEVLLQFSNLPERVLKQQRDELGIEFKKMLFISSWNDWLDKKGQDALLSSLYACRWVYVFDEDDKEYIYLNTNGRMALGIDKPLVEESHYKELRVLSDFTVYAGSNLPPENLIPLFKFCEVKKIDRVFEFRISKKALKNAPSKTSPLEELHRAFPGDEDIPQPVRSFFEIEDQPKPQGALHIRYCSAIVVPDNPELLGHIRAHPKLKGYIAPHSPKGLLMIKPESNPDNFYRRCKEYGFDIK